MSLFKKTSFKINDRAVFLPLFSVCIVGILSVLITFGLNTFIVRDAKSELKAKAKEICQGVSSSDFFSFSSIKASLLSLRTRTVFSSSLIRNKYISEIEPHFLVPGMPDNDWFDTKSNNLRSYGVGKKSFSQLGLRSCASNKQVKDCFYYSSIDKFPSDLLKKDFLNYPTSANNTLVCSFKAKVNRFFLPDINIFATTAYKKQIFGFFPKDNTRDLKNRTIEEQKGIILAIAPQLTTYARDIKFIFSNSFPNGLRTSFDPLLNFPDYLSSKKPNLSKDLTIGAKFLNGSKVDSLAIPDLISARYNSALNSKGEDLATSYSNPSYPTDYEEFLVSCMNPLILARNAFITSLSELFVRHPDFRSSIEVLLISSKHRGDSSLLTPIISNPPVKIVNFGQDLLRPDVDLSSNSASYQLPYVFYEKENKNKLFKSNSGYINPFIKTSDYSSYDSLVASQLRFCNQLYTCDSSGLGCDGGLSRYNLSLIYDNKYESDDYAAVLALRPQIGSLLWDQHCPFGVGSFCNKGGGELSSRPRFGGVNAVELLSMLGSVQTCPYEKYDSKIFKSNTCKKPTYNSNPLINESNDLQPDYLGLIRYLSKVDNAVSSPGIWKIKSIKDNKKPLDELARSGLYQEAENLRLPLIIVTHQLPSANEVVEIAELLEINSFWQQRPITIIYFPFTAAQEVEVNGIDRFKEAFKIDDIRFNNKLFIFSPLESGISLTNVNYQLYWESLISPKAGGVVEEDATIAFKALNIFNSLIELPKEIM